MDHVQAAGPVATTVAHEMGHNFAMEHDAQGCTCEDSWCIMAAASGGINPTHWSECSKRDMKDFLDKGYDYCLKDLPEKTYQGPECGNGFVEKGEECDCGVKKMCNTTCCDADTCKLTQNATCATGKCCDISTCQPKPASTLCRGPSGYCDLPEFCDGENEYCPSDVYKRNGETCSAANQDAYCYEGQCKSYTAQCQKLWGSSAKVSHDRCYTYYNKYGSAHGHCGYDWVTQTYKKCITDEEARCGMLQCDHRSPGLQFWSISHVVTTTNGYVTVNNTRHYCRGTILDVGLNYRDPAMVPNGAKCGEDKVCLNSTCVNVSTLVRPCPNCHGKGVCNTLGQCHCDYGWGPPFCDKAGPGGSLHSNPPSQDFNQDNKELITAMLVIFLFIVPCIIAGVILGYKFRHRLKNLWKHRPHIKYRDGTKPVPTASSVVASKQNHSAPPLPGPPKKTNVQRATSFRDATISSPVFESTTRELNSAEMNTIKRTPSQSAPPPRPALPAAKPVPPKPTRQAPPLPVTTQNQPKPLKPPRPVGKHEYANTSALKIKPPPPFSL